MANEIMLPLRANAEPDTCGSCKFFDRYMDRGEYYVMEGRCVIKLPPFKSRFALKPYRDGEDERSPTDVKDTDRCDLQRPDGKVYIVQRRIPAERAG